MTRCSVIATATGRESINRSTTYLERQMRFIFAAFETCKADRGRSGNGRLAAQDHCLVSDMPRHCLQTGQQLRSGGWGGIRTHETLAGLPVFKTGAFNRSTTHPVSEFKYLSSGHRAREPLGHLIAANRVRSCARFVH
jgi:hypothetical protein